MLTHPRVIIAILLVQLLSAVFFVYNLGISILGVTETLISWQLHEIIEIGAVVGLILGVVTGTIALRQTLARNALVEAQLRAASGAFSELLEEKFEQWKLTPAEKDVALFAIKGMSTHEIAGLRSTSEGTVKAQTNAIYRKAGVTGRPQLLSLFIEDLMGDSLI